MESSLETRPPTPRGTPHAYETRYKRTATYPTSDRIHKGRRYVQERPTRLTGRVFKKRRVINSIETRRERVRTNAGREIQGCGAPQDSPSPYTRPHELESERSRIGEVASSEEGTGLESARRGGGDPQATLPPPMK